LTNRVAEEAKREDFYGLIGPELFFGSITESSSSDALASAIGGSSFFKIVTLFKIIARLRGINRIHGARYRAER